MPSVVDSLADVGAAVTSITDPLDVTAGDLIVAFGGRRGGTDRTLSLGDTVNTYTILDDEYLGSSAELESAWAEATTTATLNVTVTFGGSTSGSLAAYAIQDFNSAAPIQARSQASNSSSASPVVCAASGAVDAIGDCLALMFCQFANFTTADTDPAGYTMLTFATTDARSGYKQSAAGFTDEDADFTYAGTGRASVGCVIVVDGAAVGVTGTIGLTLDSALRAQRALSAVLGGAVSTSRAVTAEIDGAIAAARSGTLDIGAALAQLGGLTAAVDAAAQIAQSATGSVDGALQAAKSIVASLDANLSAAGSSLLTAALDAALQVARDASAGLDGALQAQASGSSAVDAVLALVATVSAQLDAAVAQLLTLALGLDGALQAGRTASVSLDARLGTASTYAPAASRTFTVDPRGSISVNGRGVFVVPPNTRRH